MRFVMYVRKGIHAMCIRSKADMKAWNKKADRLEQQQAKDEVCDILRRMIAHEIRQKEATRSPKM